MMLIKGLKVIAEDDNAYGVYDCTKRLGAFIRYYKPVDPYPAVKRMFRAFGEDFETMSAVVAEFLKIKGCRPRNALGDCE
jgi:hypothetical protein